ncbi:MAG: hypothetical protein AABX82_07810 [Nanoarchaeota archaeon]
MSLYQKLKQALEKEDVVIHGEWRTIYNPAEEGSDHRFCEINIFAAPRKGVFSLDYQGLETLNHKLQALSVPFQDIPYSPFFIRIGSFEEMVRHAQEPKPSKFYVHNYELCEPHQQQPHSINVGRIFLEETVGHDYHKWSLDHDLSLNPAYQHEFSKREFEGSARNGLDTSELRRSVELNLFPSVEFLRSWDQIDKKERRRRKAGIERVNRWYDPLFEELGLVISSNKYACWHQIHLEKYSNFSTKYSPTSPLTY